MAIKFETALFGEMNKAHSLIEASDRTFGDELVPYTDLPVDLPNAVGDVPMLSGFPLNDRFVFLSVLRDRKASRGGMAITRALFTELKLVSQIENLLSVFNTMNQSDEPFVTGSKIEVLVSDSPEQQMSRDSLELFHALMSEKNSAPVIWVGQDGFSDAIAGLWRYLAETLRPSLSFRFTCRPTDSLVRQRSVVVVPPQSIGQWHTYNCLQPPFRQRDLEDVETTFFDNKKRNSVYSLASELGFTLDQINKFARVSKCSLIIQNLKLETDQNVSILVRYLSELSPSPEVAKQIKESVLLELLARVEKGSIATFKYLRNLKTDAFQDGFRKVAKTCGNRYREILRNDAAEALRCAQTALKNTQYAWSSGLLDTLERALIDPIPNAVQTFLKLLQDDQVRDENWVNKIADTISDLESKILDQIDDELPNESISGLMQFCVLHEWDRLHARLAASYLPPNEAVKAHINFPKSSREGIAELSLRLGPAKFVVEAAKTGLPAYCAQVRIDCLEEPSLFKYFNVSQIGWRSVFIAHVDAGTDFHPDLQQLKEQIELAWAMLIDAKLDDIEFFDAVSKTSYASILHFVERNKIWGRLPSTTEQRILAATAHDWIDLFYEENAASDLESPLRKEILSKIHRETLIRVGGEYRIQTALSVFNTFKELCESDFEEYRIRLFTEQSQFSTIDARMIGSFIAKRQWKATAESILADYRKYNRSDLKPALEQCVSMFSWLTKLMNSLQERPITEHEWWDEMVEILCDLYPTGPQHNRIWERAGGSLADLSDSGSGKVRWGEAIRLLRTEADASGLTIDKLCRKMKVDYWRNEAIEILISHCPFNITISLNEPFFD